MKIENDNLEFNLHESCEKSISYWVNTAVFETMWAKDRNGTYLAEYGEPASERFFNLNRDVDEITLLTPCVQILLDKSIYVYSGPDQVRWLLDNVVGDEIPVAFYRSTGIRKDGTGLILRRVQANDVIRVRNDFDPERIIAGKLVQWASLHAGMLNDQF